MAHIPRRPGRKLLLAASAVLIATAAETAAGEQAIASGAAAIARAADWIAARSPGERWGEQLTKQARPEFTPLGRALPRVRVPLSPPEAAAPAPGPVAAAAPPAAEAVPTGGPAPYALGPITSETTEGPILFFPGIPILPGGGSPIGIIGGGGGGGGGGGVVTPPTPTPAAVPEPEAWLMLVLGFGAAGAALRRRGMTSLLSDAR